MGWQFALINNTLAEIFFDEDKKILGFCYVNKSEYTTKKEKEWIRKDTARVQLTYKNKRFVDVHTGKVVPQSDAWGNIDRKDTIPIEKLWGETEDS